MFPRDVLRVFDRTTRPQKRKRVICVCEEKRLFLRLNTNPVWPPQHALFAVNCDFLDHDSFVELGGFVQYFEADCQQAEIIGRVTSATATDLMEAVEAAETIPQQHKDIMRAKWNL